MTECCVCCSKEKVRYPYLMTRGNHAVCEKCELIWLDTHITNSEKLREETEKRKAAKEWPYDAV